MVSWVAEKALPPYCPVSHLAGLCFALANSCIWLLVGFGLFLPCLGTAWHSLLSYILTTCWLHGIVLQKSWPFACLALPLEQLYAWQWLPRALSICWLARVASLLSFQSDCTWALAPCCPASCSKCLALPSCWLCGIALVLLGTCWMFGTALATCWMFGIFLMPFHLILEYSVPLLLFESAYSLILALLLSCPLALCLAFLSYCPIHLPRFYF